MHFVHNYGGFGRDISRALSLNGPILLGCGSSGRLEFCKIGGLYTRARVEASALILGAGAALCAQKSPALLRGWCYRLRPGA